MTVAIVVALLGLVVPTVAIAASVDPWPTYQPQSRCSPSAKPGMVKLSNWLQNRYPGSGSMGISRACGSGGSSEHKEGRAFDWALSATSSRDRSYAQAFLRKVLATDNSGNAAALARRMGIMYMIWNDHIYSATYRYAKRPYLHAACSKVRTCSTTLRHRDHMHISLTWAGARARTSWYTGKNPAPVTQLPPQPKPEPRPEPEPAPRPEQPSPSDGPALDVSDGRTLTLRVDGDGDTTMPRKILRKGRAYKLTVYGLYRYGAGSQAVSDAACVWSPRARRFSAGPETTVRQAYGSLDLLVNNKRAFASDCNTRTHSYSTKIVPKRNTPLRLRVATRNSDATNRALTVIVSAPRKNVRSMIPSPAKAAVAPGAGSVDEGGALALEEHLRVNVRDQGVYTDQVLQAGVRYRVQVAGAASLGKGAYTDGQCVVTNGEWEQTGSLDLRAPDADHGNLFLGGQPFAGDAPVEDSTGCAAHVHTMIYTPQTTSRVWLSVWDPFTRTDNSGQLDVHIERLDPVPTPPAAKAETGTGKAWWTQYERTTVATDDADGTVSNLRFKKGQKVRLYVSGTYSAGAGKTADASCVNSDYGWTALPAANGQDLLSLYVDGRNVTWKPWRGSGGCDANHEYTATFTTTKSGPISLAVLDLDYRDNADRLNVLLMRD